MRQIYMNAREGVDLTIEFNEPTIDDVLVCRQLLLEAIRDFDAKLVSLCERQSHKEAWQ